LLVVEVEAVVVKVVLEEVPQKAKAKGEEEDNI
jgi:hypothetical protein